MSVRKDELILEKKKGTHVLFHSPPLPSYALRLLLLCELMVSHVHPFVYIISYILCLNSYPFLAMEEF